MATSTSEILAVAVRLREQASSEADLRSAVSRSYYAALLTVDKAIPVRDSDVAKEGDSSHARIIARAQAYGGGSVPKPGRTEAIHMAKLLPKMKRERVIADYDLAATVTPEKCNEAVQRAVVVMDHCMNLQRKLAEAMAA